MDKSNPEHIKSLSKAAKDYVNEHMQVIKGYVECIFYNKDQHCKELVTESTPDYSFEITDF